MRKITFISNQDNQTFSHNSPLQFSLLSPQQNNPSTIYFNQIIFETSDSTTTKAQLFAISCSLVNKSTILNSNYCDIFKIVCLIPLISQKECNKYLVAFNTDENGLILPPVVDKISFQISGITSHHSLSSSLSQNPTVIDMSQALNTSHGLHQHLETYKIILNSDDKKSQSTYKGNSGVDFTINLPQEINLKENESWSMDLCSIFIHKHVFYEFPQSFHIKDLYFWFIGLKKVPINNEPIGQEHIEWLPYKIDRTSEIETFTNGYQLLNKMNAAIRMFSGVEENKFSLMQYGKIRWKAQPPSKPVPLALKNKYIDIFFIVRENKLGKILGFIDGKQNSPQDNGLAFSLWAQQPLYNNTTFLKLDTLMTIQPNLIVGKYLPYRWPNSIDSKPILVTCDLLKSSILGKNYIKSLKLIHTHDKFVDPYIVCSNFERNSPVELETKTFNSIRIQLCDIFGQVLPRSINDKFDKNIQTIIELIIKKS